MYICNQFASNQWPKYDQLFFLFFFLFSFHAGNLRLILPCIYSSLKIIDYHIHCSNFTPDIWALEHFKISSTYLLYNHLFIYHIDCFNSISLKIHVFSKLWRLFPLWSKVQADDWLNETNFASLFDFLIFLWHDLRNPNFYSSFYAINNCYSWIEIG